MVTYPGFSERIFEFAFNAEFALRHAAVLAACPDLPSQRAEKYKGYDVEFELHRRGGGTRSVFLQHKVARLVTSCRAPNAHFYRAARGPYFAFPLDVDQYNLIYGLARHRHRRILYCAPLCAGRRAIDDHFMQRKVCEQSVWIDVRNGGGIQDRSAHSIIYSEDGKRAARFSSEPQELQVLRPGNLEDAAQRHERGFNREEAQDLYEDVYAELIERWETIKHVPLHPPTEDDAGRSPAALVPHSSPPQMLGVDASLRELIGETAEILARWYGVTWLIIGRHKPDAKESTRGIS